MTPRARRPTARRIAWALLVPLLAISPPTTAAPRDDAHAFDFDLGHWRTQSRRLLHPLTGSHEWFAFDGETIVRPVAGGRANLAEFRASGPRGTVELIALRRYDPATGEWSIDFANPGAGTLGVPSIGRFDGARGDFYSHEPIDGRHVLVRFSIWPIGADEAQSEQAFSDDGGRTWEVNWVNRYRRLPD